jgi:hypothetical protein
VAIMTLERWKKYTDGGLTSIRSSRLKAVDAALEQYHRTKSADDLNRLRSALVGWMQDKGADWKSSVRNRHHAVDDLYREVMGVPMAKSAAEMVALSHLQDESRALIETLFRDRKLEWRSGFIRKLGDRKLEAVFTVGNEGLNTAAATDEVIRGDDSFGPTAQRGALEGGRRGLEAAKPAAPIAKAAVQYSTLPAQLLLNTLVPAEIRHQVLMALMQVFPDFMERLVASMIPFAGTIVAGGVLAKDLKKLAMESYHLNRTRMHVERSLAVREPESAMRALTRILERERNASALEASLSLVEFGSKLATTLVDGGGATGPAISAAAGVVKLTNIIRVIVRDVQEKNAANRAMADGVNITIFQTCPLVGAYYVCCAPTSALVNEIYDRWWHPGWRGDVERTVTRHLEPIRERARDVIHDHRFVIPGLERYPGVLKVNEKELEAMQARMGKTGMVGFGSHNMPPELNPTRPRR